MSVYTIDDALTRISLASGDDAYEFRHQTEQ
jgi:hypothetical protein